MSVRQVNSTRALMKWSYKSSTIETILRQIGDQMTDAEIEAIDIIKNLYFEFYLVEKASNLSKTSRFMPKFPWLTSFRTIEGFDCALDPSSLYSSSSSSSSPSLYKTTPAPSVENNNVFRAKSNRLSASPSSYEQRRRINSREASNNMPSLFQFEFVLDQLMPSTLYSFEMTARVFQAESFPTRLIRFTTTSKRVYIC